MGNIHYGKITAQDAMGGAESLRAICRFWILRCVGLLAIRRA